MSRKNGELKLLFLQNSIAELEALTTYIETNSNLLDIEYREAHSEGEAHQLIKDWKPTTIIVDAYLEEGDSLGFLDTCRESIAPVVMTSSHYSRNLEEAALEHGAEAYLPVNEDPDDIEQFFEEISKISSDAPVEH